MTQPAEVFPTLDELKVEHVRKALVLTKGNRSQAALLLGLSRRGLYNLMEEHVALKEAGRSPATPEAPEASE